MSTEEQLVAFFAYSFFIYPVTNYLISPSRPYKRWQGALYAVIFLVLVAVLHMAYENREKGPNHFQVLQIPRGTSDTKLKQKYRQLSLLTHPDKNKSPSAAAEFLRITQAYNVLQDTEKRKIYERLGDAGVKVLAQSVIDHKYIMMQMIVYYTSSAIFAFLMTFSEPSGDAIVLSAFGLVFVLLVETLLVLEEVQIPVWLLRYHTSHDVVSLLHRLFPAFMNGCRSIVGAFYVDRKVNRVAALNSLSTATQRTAQLGLAVLQDVLGSQNVAESIAEDGIVALALKTREKTPSEARILTEIVESTSLISDPARLRKHQQQQLADENSPSAYTSWIFNLFLYVAVRWVIKMPKFSVEQL